MPFHCRKWQAVVVEVRLRGMSREGVSMTQELRAGTWNMHHSDVSQESHRGVELKTRAFVASFATASRGSSVMYPVPLGLTPVLPYSPVSRGWRRLGVGD